MTMSRRPLMRALLLGASLAAYSSRAHAADADKDSADKDAPVVSSLDVVATRSIAERKQAPSTVESVDMKTIDATINAISVEDDLKYLPSILIRKRHVGDTQAPISSRTSGVGSSARTIIYVDGVLISALIGNNNTTASPKWGMAPSEAIDRIEVLYGPFSAVYPGNSVGAAIEISTHMPRQFEAGAKVLGSWQSFGEYTTQNNYPVGLIAGNLGDRVGPLAWRINAQKVVSDSQPLAVVTATRPAALSLAGTPVTGAIADVNRTNAPIFDLGLGGLEHQAQDNETFKATWEVTPSTTVAYTLGRFGNNTNSHIASYLRDPSGNPVYSGTVNIAGYSVSAPATAFSNSVYQFDEIHYMNSIAAAYVGPNHLEARLVLSDYTQARDTQAVPTGALPVAFTGGPGNITRLDGTGWRTADLVFTLRKIGPSEMHDLSFGVHSDGFVLRNRRYATADWKSGTLGALNLQGRGKTATDAAFVQDVWHISNVDVTIGGRWEHWRAYDGYNFSLAPAPSLSVFQPKLSATKFSPKLAAVWKPTETWRLSASYGGAYRFPTVTELYQVITTGVTLTVPNPSLKPEEANSVELAVEHRSDKGKIRLSYFNEQLKDALISQSAPLPPNPVTSLFTFVQNVDKVVTSGLELSIEQRDVLISGFSLSGSLTLTDPKIKEDAAFPAAVGKQTPQVSKVRATLVATYQPNDRWSYTLAGRYSEKMFGTLDNSDPIGHTYQGFEKYFVVDARVQYKVNAHVTAAVGVDNLNNDSYFLFHPFPQRTVTAELNYRF